MSCSAIAYVFFGDKLWAEDEDIPEFLEDFEDEHPEDWPLLLSGWTSKQLKKMKYADLEAARESGPVEVVVYQHHEASSYALAVRGTVASADQWDLNEVPAADSYDPATVIAAVKWCEKVGINFDPKWRFTAYYG
jgi:hypothetical protein